MGFFDKIKDMREMQQQGKAIQAQLAQEDISGSSSGGNVTIVMDGNQEPKSVAISEKLIADRDTRIAVANAMKEALVAWKKEYAKMLQKKFSSMMQ